MQHIRPRIADARLAGRARNGAWPAKPGLIQSATGRALVLVPGFATVAACIKIGIEPQSRDDEPDVPARGQAPSAATLAGGRDARCCSKR